MSTRFPTMTLCGALSRPARVRRRDVMKRIEDVTAKGMVPPHAVVIHPETARGLMNRYPQLTEAVPGDDSFRVFGVRLLFSEAVRKGSVVPVVEVPMWQSQSGLTFPLRTQPHREGDEGAA